MPIHTPTFSFLGSEPLNVIGHYQDPKRHIIGRNRAYVPILVEIGQAVRPERDMKESKKAMKETYSGKLGVRADHPR